METMNNLEKNNVVVEKSYKREQLNRMFLLTNLQAILHSPLA